MRSISSIGMRLELSIVTERIRPAWTSSFTFVRLPGQQADFAVTEQATKT